jgi:hypothetical protein
MSGSIKLIMLPVASHFITRTNATKPTLLMAKTAYPKGSFATFATSQKVALD